VLIFVGVFYTGGVAAEADNCILLEIMIIVISFNDADLLYYLFFDAFARRLWIWCTMVAVERCKPPSLSLLAPFCLIFLSPACVFASTWPETLRPFFAGSPGLFPIFTFARV